MCLNRGPRTKRHLKLAKETVATSETDFSKHLLQISWNTLWHHADMFSFKTENRTLFWDQGCRESRYYQAESSAGFLKSPTPRVGFLNQLSLRVCKVCLTFRGQESENWSLLLLYYLIVLSFSVNLPLKFSYFLILVLQKWKWENEIILKIFDQGYWISHMNEYILYFA